MHVKWPLAVVVVVVLLLGASFLSGVSANRDRSPVAFDDTLTTGMTGIDVTQASDAGYQIPRAEVFYAQYRYVVGYYGIESAASALDGDAASQFGRPLGVFVSDYSAADPYVTDGGFLAVRTDPGVGWVSAPSASFVVDSRADTPGGPAVVPFGDRGAAEAFATEAGGRVVGWDTVRDRADTDERKTIEAARTVIANRSQWADSRVRRARSLRDRPVSVVVGTDAPTLSAAVSRAPPNTTVRLPAGTYDANLTLDKPLTIAGAGNGTVLDGGASGTVLRLRSPRSAVTDLRITGVGTESTAPYTGETERWDGRTRQVFGGGDTAVRIDGANTTLLSGLSINTSSSGVVAQDTAGVVVRNVTVRGTDEWADGFMGVLSIASPMVVENATFLGGRDGVYLHDADGTVVRDSDMADLRYGVHEMYTSNTLVANNTARRTNAGVIVMTRPTGNALVGNDVRDSRIGISTSGSASYALENVVVENHWGLSPGTQRSVYTHNTIVRNDLGVRTGTILPTNLFVENDVVGNDRDVRTGRGPVRLWGKPDGGNFWGEVPGRDSDGDGVIERAYRPTGSLDSRVRESQAVATLAVSPATSALRAFGRTVPGLRNADVIDRAPLARPVRPAVLESVNASVGGSGP